jgi:hypothetical protein
LPRPRKASSNRRTPLRSTYRCRVCEELLHNVTYAAAERHMDTHGGGRLEAFAVQSTPVESPGMDDSAKTTPDDVRRIVERVALARPLLDAKIVEVVRAAHDSGFTARQIIDAAPLSRQRVYQILKPRHDHEDTVHGYLDTVTDPFLLELDRLIEDRHPGLNP